MVVLQKKIYVIVAVVLFLSGGLLTLSVIYGNFNHNAPVRAKQVLSTNFSYKQNNTYNTSENVQAMDGLIYFGK